MSAGAVLDVCALRVVFDGRPRLEDVSLSLAPGCVHVVLGRSGAGKSTLLRVLAGVHRPDGGEVRLDGRRLAAEPGTAFPAIGLLMQRPERQFFAPTVLEEVAFALSRSGCGEREVAALVPDALGRLGLGPETLARAPWSLSRGQQRLVAFASVSVFAPRVLLLDEPTAGLDPGAAGAVRAAIAAAAVGGAAVLVAGHDLAGLAPLADVLAVLGGGRLAAVDLAEPGGRARLAAAGFPLPPLWELLSERVDDFWPARRWRQSNAQLAGALAEALGEVAVGRSKDKKAPGNPRRGAC